jgi:hypothetical protein
VACPRSGQEGRSGGDLGIGGRVASAQTAALFVRAAVQALPAKRRRALEAIVSTHLLVTAVLSSYSPSAMLNMALVSLGGRSSARCGPSR